MMKNKTILNYYLQNIEFYKAKNYDKKYDPKEWIISSPDIGHNFAQYIEYLLNSSSRNEIKISNIPCLSREFYYQCITAHGILFEEECKKNRALKQVFIDTLHEIDDLGSKDCNTSQIIIDLSLDLILRPHTVFDKFMKLKKCEWDYICVTDLAKHRSFSDYLFKCLENGCEPFMVDMIIDNLSYQMDSRLYKQIEKYLIPDFPINNDYEFINNDIQSSALRYIRNVDHKDKNEILKKYKGNIFKENEAEYIVVEEIVNNGMNGLINLFTTTDNTDIKNEIIDCYDQFRSKEFASLLMNALKDETKLENGYFPVRNEAFFKLKEELFSNLIEWFGEDILDIFTNTEIEEG